MAKLTNKSNKQQSDLIFWFQTQIKSLKYFLNNSISMLWLI